MLKYYTPLLPIKVSCDTSEKGLGAVLEHKEKTSGDVIILHMCAKNHDHTMYVSSDVECDRSNFLSFYATFCLFTPH